MGCSGITLSLKTYDIQSHSQSLSSCDQWVIIIDLKSHKRLIVIVASGLVLGKDAASTAFLLKIMLVEVLAANRLHRCPTCLEWCSVQHAFAADVQIHVVIWLACILSLCFGIACLRRNLGNIQ